MTKLNPCEVIVHFEYYISFIVKKPFFSKYLKEEFFHFESEFLQYDLNISNICNELIYKFFI